ncbi:MAG TPA: FAD-dependent monooxygenase [Burkholderiaceae bacterium]|nr:FAD-dependent monooxygenase [Burkholderiaceae bacterium]
MKQMDVLIVGAGPVGLLCALGLAREGINVTILESEAGIVDSPRAMVYHWSVLAGLEKLGVLDDAMRTGFSKTDYRYLVHKTGESIEWTLDVLKGHVRHPYNVHLGQNRLAEIALRHVERLGNVELHWSTRFESLVQDEDGVTVEASGPVGVERYRAAWLIGADGARSAVRRNLGLGFDGMTWDKRFVATNIRFDLESLGHPRSTMLLDDVYGAIIAKIDKDDLWRCTYCEDPSLPEEGVADRIPDMLANILPGADSLELVQYSPYRMHQRAASRFRVGRVLLAGDSAHSTNPTGGLGLTSGLFDTYVLYEALAAVIRGEAEDSLLDRYAEERRRVFLEIASPQASENNRLVYDSGDPVRLEEDLRKLRRMATDDAFRLERSLFTRKLETPSLVSGLRAEEALVEA